MKDLQQLQTIKFIYKMEDECGSTKQRRRIVASLSESEVGRKFNSWTIVSPAIYRLYKRQELAVQAQCLCGAKKVILVQNLVSGKSKMCKRCASQERHQKLGHATISGTAIQRVQKRCNAMRQRCQNPNDQSYKNYGARGIQFKFASVAEAIAYVLMELPHPSYLEVDIDRKDNNGHYEPGNLRLANRTTNMENRRITKFCEGPNNIQILRKHVYHVLRTLYPEVKYTDQVVQNFVSKGLTMMQIVERWHQPSFKPKGCTILPMPDQGIASLYLEKLSATATSATSIEFQQRQQQSKQE